jgi:dihydroorotate dehydrogenase
MQKKSSSPFYDPLKTYEENYHEGPFGAFADKEIYHEKGEPQYEILGKKVYLPFGIPAGPLVNGNFITAAFDKGFDIAVYKTVRTHQYPCNEFPNVIPIQSEKDLSLEQAEKGVIATNNFTKPLTITNSFGVPSFPPEIWQKDMAQAVSDAEKRQGKLVIGSFQGTTNPEGDSKAYIKDFAIAAKMVKETGAKVLEVNLSCPNEGSSQLLCFDIKRATDVVIAIKEEIGDTPLIIKIAYFKEESVLKKLITEVGSLVQGIAAINTIPAKIYTDETFTKQALPGKNRLVSGTCGSAIQWAGLASVTRLKNLRDELTVSYAIFGGGGVMTSEDYVAYKKAGADVVMSATGAMWNPYLAQQIKDYK